MNLNDIGWREYTRKVPSFGDTSKIYLRQPLDESGGQWRIYYKKGEENTIVKEIVETIPIDPIFVDLDVLREGIERPLAKDGIYLDEKKVDGYLEECMRTGVIPFSFSVIADEIKRERGQKPKQGLPLRSGMFILDDIYDPRREKEFPFIGKARGAIIEAQSRGFKPHVISISTAYDGCKTFKEKMWPHILELGRVDTGTIHIMKKINKIGIECHLIDPEIRVNLRHENVIALCSEISPSEPSYVRENFKNQEKVISNWFEGLVKKYHQDNLVKRE
jgi:hypothetical protein